MEGTIKLSQAEACEAVRAYLVLRGALPAHGTVGKVGASDSNRYGSDVEVTVSIGDAPDVAPPSSRDVTDSKAGR